MLLRCIVYGGLKSSYVVFCKQIECSDSLTSKSDPSEYNTNPTDPRPTRPYRTNLVGSVESTRIGSRKLLDRVQTRVPLLHRVLVLRVVSFLKRSRRNVGQTIEGRPVSVDVPVRFLVLSFWDVSMSLLPYLSRFRKC